MPKPPKDIKAFKHSAAKRAHIPSAEEAGSEAASPAVKSGPAKVEIPLNPVVHRGQDPELFWLGKYGTQETAENPATTIDLRSIYRHEHIAPERIIKGLHRTVEADASQPDLLGHTINDYFGNATRHDELEKTSHYYNYDHADGWTNRLMQGDSLLCMSSMLHREGMAGQVQTIYFDPPYGIKYGSNWQIALHDRTVTDGKDEHLTGEPEQVKAFRDTWELGIHSYLTYLRDRLLVARDLLTNSGSIFVQISDENVHLVRSLMDEVFGSGNFVSQIFFQTTSGFATNTLATLGDFVLWYAKDKGSVKVRKLFEEQPIIPGEGNAKWVLLTDGTYRGVTAEEKRGLKQLPEGARLYFPDNLQSQGPASSPQPFEFQGKTYKPRQNSHWKANYPAGMKLLADANRLHVAKDSIRYRRFADDFPYQERGNIWTDTLTGNFTDDKLYVVQTGTKAITRCLLMTSDPGDLVLDPTCGSGTTAYVAEQWGRRWITIDTSRIALNIAKTRLMTATFPYYKLHDQDRCDLRQGFGYKKVPHITLGSIANGEPPAEETLYDQPEEIKSKLRIAGPFTVETLQSYEPLSPEELAAQRESDEGLAAFEDLVFSFLQSSGVMTGDKRERAVFTRVDRLASPVLHAEGFYNGQRTADSGQRTADSGQRTADSVTTQHTSSVEKKAYLYLGPKFGTVSKQAVSDAIKEARRKGDADWLLILGFSFESNLQDMQLDQGSFQVSIVRMHDDLLQDGLMKKDKKHASFVTIGEPDIGIEDCKLNIGDLKKGERAVQVEIRGLDIYDPIKDEVKSRAAHDIAYWMVDDDYDGTNFVVRQVFFCGGKKDEFQKWRKGLDALALAATKKKAERTLRIEIDEEAFERLYGTVSHPIRLKRPGQKIAVRVISQFGEETTKVVTP